MRQALKQLAFLVLVSAVAVSTVPRPSAAHRRRVAAAHTARLSHKTGNRKSTADIKGSLHAEARSHVQKTRPQRIFFFVDNSWSMVSPVGRSTRMEIALAAAERWARQLVVPSLATVEVLAAADRVVLIGTFSLRTEADRTALISGINQIKPLRDSHTVFRDMDAGLAEVVRHHTEPTEDFGVLGITDAESDRPEVDLRAADMGDHTIALGGVYAITLGNVPAVNALSRRGARVRHVSGGTHGELSSALRALRNSEIRLDGSPIVEGTIAPRLLGGAGSLETEFQVTNASGIARTVEFDSVTPDGVTIHISPNPMVLAGGESGKVTAEVSAAGRVGGDAAVIARLPDGRSERHAFSMQLTTRSWMAAHGWIVVAMVVIMAIMLAVFLRHLRHPVLIGQHADEDRQAAMGIGDTVPLATFHPNVTGVLQRGWLGFAIVADGDPLSASGRVVKPGGRARYRLGEVLRSGDRSFAVYRIDGTATPDHFSLPPSLHIATGGLR